MAPQPRYPLCATPEDLVANLTEVRRRIEAAAVRVGRDPGSVRLVPVSKTIGEDPITWARDAGIALVGENKVQEARSKEDLFERLDLAWAMIGHLQTNKVNHLVGSAAELHSLDRMELAERLDRRLQSEGTSLDVFIQVNSSAEASKYGLAPDEVEAFARALAPMHSLRVRGLMTLAVFSEDRERVRACFETMVDLRDRLRQSMPDPAQYDELSMGMSGDYELAVECGASTVRVGQAIFGARATGPDHYWPAT